MLALGLLCTAVPMAIFMRLIRAAGPTRAAMTGYLVPTVATIMGIIVLNETLELRQLDRRLHHPRRRLPGFDSAADGGGGVKAIIIGSVLIAAVAAGCQSSRPPATVAFSAEEAAFIKKPGSGVIVGHAFRTRSRGQVVNAAGEVVRLVPATAFARERFRQLYGERKYVPASAYPSQDKPDPAYAEYTRTTKAEANGRFAFDKVAPGSYFITTQVIWGEEGVAIREGGSVYDTVTLTGKETEPVNVILSGN